MDNCSSFVCKQNNHQIKNPSSRISHCDSKNSLNKSKNLISKNLCFPECNINNIGEKVVSPVPSYPNICYAGCPAGKENEFIKNNGKQKQNKLKVYNDIKVEFNQSSTKPEMCDLPKQEKLRTATKNEGWCKCRNLPAYKVNGKKVVCIPKNDKKLKCLAKNVCIRPKLLIPRNNLNAAKVPLQDDTTYKVDYPPKRPNPPKPIIPQPKMPKNDDPMQSDTIYKNHYIPMPHSKRDPLVPPNELVPATSPMEGDTTTGLSYKAPKCFSPTKLIIPEGAYKPPYGPMQSETSHKRDFVDWHCRGPVGPFPWTPSNKFIPPKLQMEGDTTYKTNYKGTEFSCRRSLIIPKGQGIGINSVDFDDGTTYKNDYIPWEMMNEEDCIGVECMPPCPPEERYPCFCCW